MQKEIKDIKEPKRENESEGVANRKGIGKGMMFAILSLSLLTVMAGAAVAPALGTMREHFSGASGTLVQMIISMPALFIFLTSFIFPKLCREFGSRTLVMIGLALYVLGGCGASLFDNIYIVLIFRALVGCGVGFIMPLSTGLLSYHYPPEELDKLMGLSSAMNQMGGAVATFIAGLLATLSWRAAFMVYLMGLISVVLCALFLSNEKIAEKDEKIRENYELNPEGVRPEIEDSSAQSGNYGIYIAAMFVLMSTFFIYPSNYALESVSIMSQEAIATVMALMDVVAFLGGLCFVHIRSKLHDNAHFAAPFLFITGYVLLAIANGMVLSIIGSFLVGFANGAGIPCIIAAASKKAGRSAAMAVMPMLSAAMYMGQFLSPFIMAAVTAAFGGGGPVHLPFCFAALLAIALVFLAAAMKKADIRRG